jgi:tetratricopeptide (TPR) repeat protein
LRIYESLGNAEGEAYALNALGIIYESLKKYDLAKSYYGRSLQLLKKAGIEHKQNMLYCNLGNVLHEEGKPLESILYYKKALEISEKFVDTNSICIQLINLADIYCDLGRNDSARMYYSNVLRLSFHKAGDYEQFRAYSYKGLGELELKENRFEKAAAYLLQAERISESAGI